MANQLSWYAYDPSSGFDVFSTAAEAEKWAEEALADHRENGEWPADVEAIEWGLLVPFECAEEDEGSRVPTPGGEFDYTTDYALQTQPFPKELVARIIGGMIADAGGFKLVHHGKLLDSGAIKVLCTTGHPDMTMFIEDVLHLALRTLGLRAEIGEHGIQVIVRKPGESAK